MNSGVRVMIIDIPYKGYSENIVPQQGYILRQIDADLYEVYGETTQETYLLNSIQFVEL